MTRANFNVLPCHPTSLRRVKRRLNGAIRRKYLQLFYQEQDGICAYCPRHVPFEEWTLDHKVPLVRGGTNAHANLVGCCRPCNIEKGDRTDQEFRPRSS